MVSRVSRITRKLKVWSLFPQFAPKDKPPNITFGGYFVLKTGGEGGIRTLDTFDSIPVFESVFLHII